MSLIEQVSLHDHIWIRIGHYLLMNDFSLSAKLNIFHGFAREHEMVQYKPDIRLVDWRRSLGHHRDGSVIMTSWNFAATDDISY